MLCGALGAWTWPAFAQSDGVLADGVGDSVLAPVNPPAEPANVAPANQPLPFPIDFYSPTTVTADTILRDEVNEATNASVIDLRLRFQWQSPTERHWIGNLLLPKGRISDLKLLENHASEPGSYVIPTQPGFGAESLFVAPRVKSLRSGFEVNVRGPEDALLLLELVPDHESERKFSLGGGSGVALKDLLQKDYHEPMGDGAIHITRSPGDRIRIQLERDALVFQPGEVMRLKAWAHHLNVRPGTNLRAKFRVRRSEQRLDVAVLKKFIDDDVKWSHEETWRIGEQRSSQSIANINFEVPKEEGVYELAIDCVLPLPQVGTAAKRKVQFIVVDDSKVTAQQAALLPEVESEFDPTESKWYAQLPQWTRPRTQRGPWGNSNPQVWEHNGQRWTKIGGATWIAYPLQIEKLGVPHIVDVEFPADFYQNVRLGIFEASEQNGLPTQTLSGLEIGDPDIAARTSQPTRVHQRLTFWPKTASPILVISNQSNDSSLAFGRVRIEAYSQGLPARGRIQRQVVLNQTVFPTTNDVLPLLSAGADLAPYFNSIGNLNDDRGNGLQVTNAPMSKASAAGVKGRQRIMMLDPDQMMARFSPRRPRNDRLKTNFDDWRTFQDVVDRMINYLHFAGYDGVSLTVHGKGSSLYPSRLLHPTPRFDRGIFADRGQDPIRKDVLEYLFRRFGREDLTLIPAIEFTSPLPKLERLLPTQDADGIELVELVGPDPGQTRKSEAAPYYNPLDARVQAAMQNVVQELLDRYSGHVAFGGLRLNFSKDSATHFPDAQWGFDEPTLAAFQNSLGIESRPDVQAKRLRDEILSDRGGDLKKAWLSWRAKQLAIFYRRLGSFVERRSNRSLKSQGSRLYLSMADLNETVALQSRLRPSLQKDIDFDAAMLSMGIDLQLLTQSNVKEDLGRTNGGLVVLRPQPYAALSQLRVEGANMGLRGPDIQKAFATSSTISKNDLRSPLNASQSYDDVPPATEFRYRTESFADFPFDALPGNHAGLSSAAHEYTVCRAGDHVRQPYSQSLARFDDFMIFEAGENALVGQEQHAETFFDVFRRLPAIPFSAVKVKDPNTNKQHVLEPRPLVIRQATHGKHTYVYTVNPSPWPIKASLHFKKDQSSNPNLTIVGAEEQQELTSLFDQNIVDFVVRPYGLVLFDFDSANVELLNCRTELPNGLSQQLKAQLVSIRSRAGMLAQIESTTSPFPDPSFERVDLPDAAWSKFIAPGGKGREELNSDAGLVAEGTRSLRMKAVDVPVSITSQAFSTPETGRLALSLQIRSSQPGPAPVAVRLTSSDSDFQVSHELVRTALTTEFQRVEIPFTDIPPYAKKLRVKVEMIGRGEVWIDDLRVNDTAFTAKERNQLEKILQIAFYQYETNDLLHCHESLSGYWPRFLMRYIGPIEVAQNDSSSRPPAKPQQQKRSFLDRWKIPRMPTFRIH